MLNKDRLIKSAIMLFIIVIVMGLFLIMILPDLIPIVSAIASLILAIGTFFMVYVTYESYRSLTEIQKRSFHPYLSVSLWKHSHADIESLSFYGITIRNDGPGLAENVVLTTNWILFSSKKDNKTFHKRKSKNLIYSGEGKIKIGRIATKDRREISQIIGASNLSINKVWGVKILATCEDIFGNKNQKYFDEQELFLHDAEIKST